MSGNFLYQKFEKQLDEVDALTSKPKTEPDVSGDGEPEAISLSIL